jgi:hypothetical protein
MAVTAATVETEGLDPTLHARAFFTSLDADFELTEELVEQAPDHADATIAGKYPFYRRGNLRGFACVGSAVPVVEILLQRQSEISPLRCPPGPFYIALVDLHWYVGFHRMCDHVQIRMWRSVMRSRQ